MWSSIDDRTFGAGAERDDGESNGGETVQAAGAHCRVLRGRDGCYHGRGIRRHGNGWFMDGSDDAGQ